MRRVWAGRFGPVGQVNQVMSRLASLTQGNSLAARVMRSGSWMVIGYGGNQALRLAANLILTRLLFPDAFGLMTLVNVVLVGLQMFSDFGLVPSIAQNPRGDDPDFLDTAWTLQTIRGGVLWLLTCLLAYPAAQFYNEPDLALYLPIAGLTILISGFNTTKIETANRHLMVGRLTVLDLTSQVLGMVAMVWMAWVMQSVLALVLGGIVQTSLRWGLTWYLLPGHRNRFRLERAAAHNLLHFGKWLFFSTVFWFFTSQGDRVILGKFISLEMLGLYNIGYFLASFPTLMAQNINGRLLIPVYRDKPPRDSRKNFRNLRKLRSGITLVLLALSMAFAFGGPALVDLLYDPRYDLSGPIVTLVACMLTPAMIAVTYDQAPLAAGDSRSYFFFSMARAMAMIGSILFGAIHFGLIGAIVGMGAGTVLTYPVVVWISVKHGVWDPLHDLVFAVLTAIPVAGAIWLHWDKIIALAAAS